jgi:tetratricopeptide (TPR) repeat protein
MLLRLLVAGVLVLPAGDQTLEEAKRAFDAGNYAAAARLFEKAHQVSPRCDIPFYLGLARYRLKQLDAALIAFQVAVQCDPKLVPAHLALGEAYAVKGNDGEALSAYLRALDLAPKNRSALQGAASIYLHNQVNDKAVPLLETLVTLDTGSAPARVDLAAAYAATGNRDDAELQFQEALRLKPNYASAMMGLANLYLKKGDEAKAISLLQKAVRIAPNAYELRFLLGSAYNRLGRYRQALVELQSALSRGGGNSSEVYYHLARAYGGLGRQEDRRKALARFAELAQKSKQDTEAQRFAMKLVEQAGSLVDAGDLQTAAARMEEARELRPSDDRILFRLASVYFDLQRYELARNYAQEAISLAPSEWLYHYLLGLVEKSSERWQPAQSSLEIAVRLNSSAAEAHNALGEVALRQNDPLRALASFQRAVELDPQQPAYRSNLEAARRAARDR